MPDSGQRLNFQRWVFFLAESPQNTLKMKDFSQLNSQFNWTVTYRLDSDIVFRYGTIERIPVSQQHVATSWHTPPSATDGRNRNRKRLVAWFVSNCHTASRREEYVREMRKYVPVDVYGKCGDLSCPRASNICDRLLDNSYMFTLAFENSLCRDYVTEKLFLSLKRNSVLVVMGNANYSCIAPPNSYIDVADFASPKDLADYLVYLR
ncbi:PREDICTED: alpha-(1,3)-fucosyltransferase C-like [Priapulus caudatus]|uniref:Fucosyltransferase n=1 Tax=Priapulus caudatus TaxID=37621 RepID=A0ABM1EGG2_PRICU|nr:PREDICTED: alpha-(1,3)-fucosyltransferase C-like [Priapulus caudatus]